MDIPTIVALRNCRDRLRNSLRSFTSTRHSDERYGNEQEYIAKGIVAGLFAILTDLSALIKAPAQLIQKTTHSERTQLAACIEKLNVYVESGNLHELVTVIDEIKPLLRSLGVRYTTERLEAFDGQINEIQKNASDLSQRIVDVEEILVEGNRLKAEIKDTHHALTQEIESLDKQRGDLDETINLTREKHSELDNLLSVDIERSEQIEQLLANSNSHTKTIDNFSKKIASRESQLEKQEVASQQYRDKLEEFKADHERHLSEAKELIKNAKLALEYKTAEGLSAAFTEQYNKANKTQPKGAWLGIAGVCVVASICLGIWLTVEKDVSLNIIVARISLFPILIGTAWFSAGQYVKQKNIAEDYAYKAVLAKSIVGFSDQLSKESDKGEDYSHFIKSVLTQIHKDPLRKHTLKYPADKKVNNAEKP